MDGRYPEVVRRLNRLLVSELGSNPRYAWRWSEDLLHIMAVVDDIGRPQYVDVPIHLPNNKIIYGRAQARVTRKLLPHHHEQWVCCALVDVGGEDGQLEHTGQASWVPLSSSISGPAALPHGVKPSDELTQCVIRSVREERSKPKGYLITDYEEADAKREKAAWNRAYDRISNAATAFYNVPGKRGHVSFPSVKPPENGLKSISPSTMET